jgi:hypothetical protein
MSTLKGINSALSAEWGVHPAEGASLFRPTCGFHKFQTERNTTLADLPPLQVVACAGTSPDQAGLCEKIRGAD